MRITNLNLEIGGHQVNVKVTKRGASGIDVQASVIINSNEKKADYIVSNSYADEDGWVVANWIFATTIGVRKGRHASTYVDRLGEKYPLASVTNSEICDLSNLIQRMC